MASTLCKFHIVLVVIGVSVTLFQPSESALDFQLLSDILSNYKFLSKIFGSKTEQTPKWKLQDSHSTVFTQDSNEEDSCTEDTDAEDSNAEYSDREYSEGEYLNEEDSNQRLDEYLIGSKQNLTALEITYKNSPNFLTKIKELRGQFSHIRNVAGDGNCFYRAYAFGYFEYLLNHSQKIANFRTLVRKLKDELFNWFDENYVKKMHKMFEEVITVTESGNPESLFNILNQPSYSDNVVQYLRFITSAEIRKKEAKYCHYITEEITFNDYCYKEVETMGKESDNIHIMALSTALNINVRVVSINASPFPRPMIVEFPEENLPCCINLLHLPGHYNILYNITDETCN